MQALKALVIIMGVLIVAGTAVVVVTIYNRMNRMADVEATAPPPAPAPAMPPASFGAASVTIPDGCRITATIPAGERLLLQLGSAPRCNRILVLDLASGRLLGSIDLVPQD